MHFCYFWKLWNSWAQFILYGSNSDQSTAEDPPAQLRATLYTSNRTFLQVELNACESWSPWRKAPPILWCSREEQENGFLSMLDIQWEASIQQDKLFVAIWDLKERNCIILYQLEHFRDIQLLQKTGLTLKKAFTQVNLHIKSSNKVLWDYFNILKLNEPKKKRKKV